MRPTPPSRLTFSGAGITGTAAHAGCALVLALVLTACGNNQDMALRSIDQIHREDGVPVQVRVAEPVPFRTYMSFTATLSGMVESTASAMVADRVAGILYQVGDYVEKDDAVILFPPDNPSLNYEQARVGFESARTAYERIQRLYSANAISQQAYDDVRTQFDLARANWNAVQNITRVRAPVSGFLTRIHVFESDNVAHGDHLFTVADLERLKTTVWLTDRQVQELQIGLAARAVWQGVEVHGEVVQVDMAMDSRRKAFAAKLHFDNPGRRIPSGVSATVEIETYANKQAIILTQRDVFETAGGHAVMVARNGVAHQVPVEISRRQGLLVELGSGLLVGDEVITSGYELVSDGQPLRIMERQERLVQQ